jgi:hypothetical protein
MNFIYLGMARNLPDEVVPILETVQSRFFSKDTPLDFWIIDHGPSILDGFMDLATQLQLAIFAGHSAEKWPGGYIMLMVLFNWEAAAQSDGWSQYFESSDGEIDGVCMLFSHVGLPDEAKSIRRAWAAADSDSDSTVVADAYGAHLHEYSVDLDRLEYLSQWFCDAADELLYRS